VMLGLLDKVWKEDKLLAELNRIEKLVGRHLHDRQRGAARATDVMREFIQNRRENILREFKQWPAPVLARPRKPSYTVNVGSAKGTFSTIWNDAPAANPPRSGKVSIELKLDGKVVKFKEIGATAANVQNRGIGRFGRRGNQQPQANVVLAGIPTNGQRVTLTLSMNRSAFAASAGKSVSVQGSFSFGNGGGGGGFGGFNPRGGRSVVGTIRFDKVGTTAGQPVNGEFNVRIVESRGGMFGGGQAAVERPGAKKRNVRLKQALALFKKFDANQDGKLQKSEWQKSGKSLEKADTNSDGKVSLAELLNWLKKSAPKGRSK